jgi:hypothetical protein
MHASVDFAHWNGWDGFGNLGVNHRRQGEEERYGKTGKRASHEFLTRSLTGETFTLEAQKFRRPNGSLRLLDEVCRVGEERR